MKAKKIIIPLAIIAGVVVIGILVAVLGNAASTVAYEETVTVEEKIIENKISVNGIIMSDKVKKVYSELNYPVEKINVSVGDVVKKGDVLCTINTDDLQQQILQQQYNVESSGLNEDYSLSSSEEKYNNALENYENGENTSVMAAEKAVLQAEKALESAKRAENDGIDTILPDAIEDAGNNLESTKKAFERSQEAYEKALRELKPENYPASVKKLYNTINELEERLELISSTNDIQELNNAKARYNTAKGKSDLLSMYSTMYSVPEAEAIAAEYTAAKAELAEMEAKYDRETIEEQLENARIQYENALEGLENSLAAAETTRDNAEAAYKKAVKAQEKTEKSSETSIDDYSDAVKEAEKALADAKKNYDLTVRQVEAELSALKKSAEQQRILSGLNNPQLVILENLKNKLEYAVVTAPCDGVVTAVNAEEGIMASGPVFVIEDLSDLKISASVGEYDIPYVAEGMDVIIKCDAITEAEYAGKVSSVAPTGVAGSTGTSYAIEVVIDNEDEKILVGMSAKVAIISDKRENALAITYDALTKDENGNDAVYVAEKDENGVYHAKLVVVEIGIETDYEIEIISDEISAGMYLLTNTEMLSDGDVVVIDDSGEEQVEE